jgi:hypothetical protein
MINRDELIRAIALLVLAAAAALAATMQAPVSVAADPEPGPGLRTQKGNYSVFARPARPNDDVSGWRVSRRPPDSGVRFPDARLVHQNAHRAVAAVPAPGGPCLVTQFRDGSGAFTCSPALMHGASIGLVPDSVKTVTYTLTDGSTEQQEVVDNTWRSPAEAERVTYVLDGQVESIALMPLSSLPKNARLSESGVVEPAS